MRGTLVSEPAPADSLAVLDYLVCHIYGGTGATGGHRAESVEGSFGSECELFHQGSLAEMDIALETGTRLV